MGIWSFVKNAGRELFHKDSPKEAAIRKELEDLGLDAKGIDIKVDGDKVTLEGKAANQEIKEKIILAAGNVDGIASVEDDTVDKDGNVSVFYTVKKGDTLWAISEAELGNGARYKEIFEANIPMLSDPDKIYPGQTLRVPTK